MELGEGHGYCETEVEKTPWFREAKPTVDRLSRYEEAMVRLLGPRTRSPDTEQRYGFHVPIYTNMRRVQSIM